MKSSRKEITKIWKHQDIKRLISSVKTLRLEIPANKSDEQWTYIDNFLVKPGKNNLL